MHHTVRGACGTPEAGTRTAYVQWWCISSPVPLVRTVRRRLVRAACTHTVQRRRPHHGRTCQHRASRRRRRWALPGASCPVPLVRIVHRYAYPARTARLWHSVRVSTEEHYVDEDDPHERGDEGEREEPGEQDGAAVGPTLGRDAMLRVDVRRVYHVTATASPRVDVASSVFVKFRVLLAHHPTAGEEKPRRWASRGEGMGFNLASLACVEANTEKRQYYAEKWRWWGPLPLILSTGGPL